MGVLSRSVSGTRERETEREERRFLSAEGPVHLV